MLLLPVTVISLLVLLAFDDIGRLFFCANVLRPLIIDCRDNHFEYNNDKRHLNRGWGRGGMGLEWWIWRRTVTYYHLLVKDNGQR